MSNKVLVSKILGVGSYLPPTVWTNNDLKQLMDTSDEWIVQRTGIRERRWVDPASGMTTSDLALEAAKVAIANAKIDKSEIDMIIFATLSPDHEFPGTGCFLQAKLGLPGIPAYDIRQQCSGFIYGLSMADHFVRAGTCRKVLVVGAELHSKGLDKTTRGRDVGVLFGDGAGAAIVGAEEVEASQLKTCSRILGTRLHADGKYAKELWIEAPGMGYPGERFREDFFEAGKQYPYMNGKIVFINAVRRMPEVMQEVLTANNLTVADVDLFVLHQANLRINEKVAQMMGIPAEKVFNTIERFGNTTAATIPIGMDEAVKAGKLKPGMLVASAAFGSGFTWSASLIRW